MTKAEEIAILRKAAEQLGPNSYCGPWLEEEIPLIESDIRGDQSPRASFREARRNAEATIEDAKAYAARLVEDAKKQRDLILANAKSDADNARARAKSELHKCLALL